MGAVRFRSSPETARVECHTVATADELDVHLAIRHTVFVDEQRLFHDTDRDVFDSDTSACHVLGSVDDQAAGTVRLYRIPAEGEVLWKGDRLAVLPEFRHIGLGGPLVRHAVATAGAAGGDRMIAFVQLANVVFFRRLGWSPVGDPFSYVGVPHQQMSIGLA